MLWAVAFMLVLLLSLHRDHGHIKTFRLYSYFSHCMDDNEPCKSYTDIRPEWHAHRSSGYMAVLDHI